MFCVYRVLAMTIGALWFECNNRQVKKDIIYLPLSARVSYVAHATLWLLGVELSLIIIIVLRHRIV